MYLIKIEFILGLILIAYLSCRNKPSEMPIADNKDSKTEKTLDAKSMKDSIFSADQPSSAEIKAKIAINKELWSDLEEDYHGFVMDIRYATPNNFTKKVIYDCPKCLLRPVVAKSLDDANKYLIERFKLRIKLFDCYRPQPYQQRLWDIVPNASYVTPPARGSMHSRGMAVDLTLVDDRGIEVDMGTAFDFFGEEAHQGYPKHSEAVKRNRYILRSTMEKYGFKPIKTEWWHFSYGRKNYPLSDFIWSCN